MKRDPVITIVAVMVVSLILVFALNLMRLSHNPSYAVVRVEGQVAHNFTLQSLNGKEVYLSNFHGKAVLLNFWETSCEPSRIEIPWFCGTTEAIWAPGTADFGNCHGRRHQFGRHS
jgi:hypothetical protein